MIGGYAPGREEPARSRWIDQRAP